MVVRWLIELQPGVRLDGILNGFDEDLAGNRFVQVGRAADAPGFLSVLFIFERGDKNDGDVRAGFNQAAVKLNPGHATQLDIQHKAVDRLTARALQKRLGGSINRRSETGRAQPSSDGAGEALVIVHHRDRYFIFIHRNEQG